MNTDLTHRDLEEEVAFRKRRQSVFGGSDAAKVFGFSRWGNALDVYHSKTRPVRPEVVEAEMEEGHSIDLWRGHRNERDAVHLYLEMRGREGRHESRQIKADGTDRVAVHVDGTVYSDPDAEAPFDGTGVVEAKSPRARTFRRLIEEGVGKHYLVQCHFNAAVTGRPWAALAVFCDHHDAGPLLPVEVAADEELGRLMIERADRFMRECVEARRPPDPEEWDLSEDERTAGEVLTGRSGEYREIREEEFLQGIARPLLALHRQKKEKEEAFERKREEAQEWLEEHTDTDAARLPEGHKLRIVRRAGRTYLDKGRLRAHRPIDRDAFVRWLREDAFDEIAGGGPVDEEELADRLELKFERFERQGSPSAHVRVYPAKGGS